MEARPDRLTYTVKEAATVLGISPDLLGDAVRSNQVPHVRLGRRILIPVRALEQFVERESLKAVSNG